MENFAEDLKQPLIETCSLTSDKEYINYANDEGSSSGYESTDLDLSDAEADDKFHVPERRHVAGHVSARVKSTNVLCESLKMIVDMPELCDVTFLVGPKKTPVHGVRAILGTRSKVMYQLIIQHMRLRGENSKKGVRKYWNTDRLIIPVKKYSPEVFRMIVQFFHCGIVKISDSTVFGLLCGAHQFDLRDLQKACWQYVNERLQFGAGDRILHTAEHYREHGQTQAIVEEIRHRMERILSKNENGDFS